MKIARLRVMAQRYALEVFVLYLLAAASCSDEHELEPGRETSGTSGGKVAGSGGAAEAGRSAGSAGAGRGAGSTGAGRSAGASGAAGEGKAGTSGGPLNNGDECVPARAASPDAGVCAGGYKEWDGCKARYEDVQCYIADTTLAEPECLPASDPSLVGRLGDYILSAGFVPEFVIETVPTRTLPARCEAVLACCEQSHAADYLKHNCFDRVDDTHFDDEYKCTVSNLPSVEKMYMCTAPGFDADAGVAADSRHSLCCYRTCGHLRDT
jgi:hypothetical protein